MRWFVADQELKEATQFCLTAYAKHQTGIQLAGIPHAFLLSISLFFNEVSDLKCSQCLLSLATKSLGYTTVMGLSPCEQSFFVSSNNRISGLHNTDGCKTLSADYFC